MGCGGAGGWLGCAGTGGLLRAIGAAWVGRLMRRTGLITSTLAIPKRMTSWGSPVFGVTVTLRGVVILGSAVYVQAWMLVW